MEGIPFCLITVRNFLPIFRNPIPESRGNRNRISVNFNKLPNRFGHADKGMYTPQYGALSPEAGVILPASLIAIVLSIPKRKIPGI